MGTAGLAFLRPAVDTSGAIFFPGLGFVTFYGFLKIADSFSDAFTHFGQLFAAEKEQDEQADDQEFRYA